MNNKWLRLSIIVMLILSLQFLPSNSRDETVDVTVISSFDNDNKALIQSMSKVPQGTTLSLQDTLLRSEGYQFIYWIVNGEVKPLPLDHGFVLMEDTVIHAVFSPLNQYAQVFMDYDGSPINIHYSLFNDQVFEPLDDFWGQAIESFSKEGYILIDGQARWLPSLDDTSQHRIRRLQYLAIEAQRFTITVENGTGSGVYAYNERVTVEADAPALGFVFSHWRVNDEVVSEEPLYQFNASADKTITAVFEENTDEIWVTLFANISGAQVSIDQEGPFTVGETVSLHAEEVQGYTFLYWQDIDSEHLVSTTRSPSLELHRSMNVKAIYQAKGTLEVFSDFENSSKSTYAVDSVDVNGRRWRLDNALIGTLNQDQKNGARSVRMQNGGILQTEFSVLNPSQVRFYHGLYNQQADFTVEIFFEVSFDNLRWHTLDLVPVNHQFKEYRYDVNLLDWHAEYGIDSDTPVYFRLYYVYSDTSQNPNNVRVNIDDFAIDTYDAFVGYPLSPYLSNRLSFSFDRAFDDTFSLGETWIVNPCTAYDEVIGEVACEWEGSVNTQERGWYTITYRAIDSFGNSVEYSVDKAVMRDATLLEVELDDYYRDVEGLFGEELKLALRALLLREAQLLPYGEARFVLQESDQYPDDPTKVWNIYDRVAVEATWVGDATRLWEREHVWPNSRLGVPRADNFTISIATDLHNLRAITPSVNQSRSNLFFDFQTVSRVSYYPGEDRGDVARIYFYMVTKYDHLILRDTLADEPTYTRQGAIQGFLSSLLAFHFDDPVDDFERHRNQVIYTYQNNRNPFIDYPHFVELIWFDHDAIPLP